MLRLVHETEHFKVRQLLPLNANPKLSILLPVVIEYMKNSHQNIHFSNKV